MKSEIGRKEEEKGKENRRGWVEHRRECEGVRERTGREDEGANMERE